MTEATANDWIIQKRDALAAVQLSVQAKMVGRVEHVADGIAFVSGLPDARLNELLQFDNGCIGFALRLEEHLISAVLLDASEGIAAGSRVTGTGRVVNVPVGEALLGRVVDPLGRPLDESQAPACSEHWPIERPAPAIIDRDLVSEPLATGILLVDALLAIGRGQRELIIGDRATGKTAIALDAIVNQKASDVVCVYVAIGQRASAVQRAIQTVRQYGAPGRCIFVVASAAAPPGLQWIAPFAAFTMAEYFRDRGQHVLVVLDDLSKHAATHRELALLTHEAPGREAYPGDVFYLHSRLLERAAKLSQARGGGSLTALPIAETDAGNLSSYIPTNLISITDGQIVLDGELFSANQRPAINVGLSVSRVGGKAQPPALRKVSGRLRMDYTQFLELELFTRFSGSAGSHVDQSIQRGQRIRALLTQGRFSPLRPIDAVALLSALNQGLLDSVPVARLHELRQALPDWLNSQDIGTLAETLQSKDLDASAQEKMLRVMTDLARRFTPTAAS